MLWLLLLFAVVAVLALKLTLDAGERRYQQEITAAENSAEQRHLDLMEKTDPVQIEGISPAELQHLIGASTPLSLRTYGSSYVINWTDSQTNATYRFQFDSKRQFSSRSGRWHDWMTPQPARMHSERPQEIISQIGDWLAPEVGNFRYPVAFVLWVALYIEYRRRPHRRGIFAYLLVSWTLLCLMTWLAGSERLLSLNGILDHQSNFWGVIMLLMTWATIFFGGLRNEYTSSFSCLQCGYSLKGNLTGRCPECGTEHELVGDQTTV